MRAKPVIPVLALAVFLSTSSLHAADREIRSTLSDQKEVAVTIYNQNLALVRDVRSVKLARGENTLAFREVSAQMRPETALLRSLSHSKGFYLIEQNFDFDLLTPAKLLEKYVGRKVGVVKTHPTTGAEEVRDALVLSANNGVVLKIGDQIETGIPGRIVYPEVPENLRDRPTLVTQLHSATGNSQTLELDYLTGGLGWKADYVAQLDQNDEKIDLNGWVTLTNTSGTRYNNARLQLVAGDVNRAREEIARVLAGRADMASKAAEAPSMAEESLFEYHLYTLNRPTNIGDNQTKQVALMSANAVPVKKEFQLRGANYYYRSSYGDLGQKLKVGVYMQFDNSKKHGLGLPLPRGVVRVYKKDSSGSLQFVGEDRIDHTPKNEEVRLRLGNAFDVTAKKKQTGFRKRPALGEYSHVFDSGYEIVLKNAKDEAVTVKVLEPVPGDWVILNESHPHRKEAAGTAVWNVRVPAGGSTTLRYTVQVRY